MSERRCGAPPTQPHGEPDVCPIPHTYGSTCSYKCQAGYVKCVVCVREALWCAAHSAPRRARRVSHPTHIRLHLLLQVSGRLCEVCCVCQRSVVVRRPLSPTVSQTCVPSHTHTAPPAPTSVRPAITCQPTGSPPVNVPSRPHLMAARLTWRGQTHRRLV